MYRRCADTRGHAGHRARGVAPWAAALLLSSFVLGGCGSTPPAEQAAPADSSAPSTDGKQETAATTSAAAPTEPPIPPEATQQFDNAIAQMTSGNIAGAEQSLRTLASTYPMYSGALVNLGIVLTRSGRFADAEQAIRGAIERNANNAAAFNQLGIVYRKLGRFKDAEQAYQRAVAIDPNYALAHLNLGVLCDLYLQQPQRALESYERYLALATTPDQKVTAWVAELKSRLGAEPRSAKTE